MSSKNKTTDTKEEAKLALVPKLRFPKYQDSTGWKYSLLGKLLMKSPDYGVNAAAVPFSELLPKYLRITDISDDGTYLSDKKVSVDLEPKDEMYLDEGDIVLARTGASVGKSYRYRKEDGRLVFAGFLIRVKPNPKQLVSTYLANFLTTEQYWKWVVTTSARSGQPGINSVEYSSLIIPLPAEFSEQQKIAECLSSVDELLAAQARKVDALKTHKKGLMQQLFPREGEIKPRRRFPEFQNAGEWEPRMLKDISEAIFDGTHQTPTYMPTGVPFYSVENLISGNANKFISRDDYLLATKKNKPEKGDVLITRIGKIGHSQVVTWDHEFSVYVTLAVVKQSKGINSHFLSHFMQSDNYQSELRSKSLPNAVPPKINLDSLRTTQVLLPKENEQHRIASCLSSLDNLITAESKKLEALKSHKKGLMQQLFPSSEEVEV